MNLIVLKRRADALRSVMKKASRALLEFEVAQSKWEASRGMGKVYSSASSLIKDALESSKRS